MCIRDRFKQARDKKIPVSGPLVKAKADEFASSLGKNEFKASSGWLDGFKERTDMSLKTVCGASGSVDIEAANSWKDDLLQMISDRDAKDIFKFASLISLIRFCVIFS